MTCSEILIAACNLISESAGETVTDDFGERAPYIISSFCGMAATADKHYRLAFSLGAQPEFNRLRLNSSDPFPLSDRFIPSAQAYLAAMLIAAENPELSATLRENARNDLLAAYDEIPATIHGIINSYI